LWNEAGNFTPVKKQRVIERNKEKTGGENCGKSQGTEKRGEKGEKLPRKLSNQSCAESEKKESSWFWASRNGKKRGPKWLGKGGGTSGENKAEKRKKKARARW